MIRYILTIGLISGLALSVGTAMAGPEHGHGANKGTDALPMCPVMDEPINFAWSVATADGPVFFCCKDCIPKYRASTQKYAEKVAKQRKALAGRPKVQVTCPVTGESVDPKVFAGEGKGKVYFCCKMCVGKYQADPGKYKANLANGYTYQTICPVMENKINPQAFTTLAGGQKIYFCCQMCETPLFKEPAKYAPKLAEQGFKIKPEQIKPEKKDKDGGHDHSGHDH